MKKQSRRKAAKTTRTKSSARTKKAAKPRTAAQWNLPHLPAGLEATVERKVEFQWTIAAYNPDLPLVFSTPAMIALMEVAAAKAIEPHLPPGTISVGTRIEVDHLKAVPLNAIVQARARLLGNDGRFLSFEVQAKSDELLIGRGKVFRAIVSLPDFHARARTKS